MQFRKINSFCAIVSLFSVLGLVSCGGGGSSSGGASATGTNSGDTSTQAPVTLYGFQVTLSGLPGNQAIVVTNTKAASGGVASTVLTSTSSSSQNLALLSTYASGTQYDFVVSPQTSGVTCTILNGSGTIISSDVVNISISCTQAPTSKFEYVANYGDNTVSGYAIDSSNGSLTAVPGSPFATGANPISIAIDNKNKIALIANATSNNVSAYKINSSSGVLTQVSGSPFAAGSNPMAIAITPSGQFAYIANRGGTGSGSLTAYSIDSVTGNLANISGSPYSAVANPQSLVIDPAGNFLYVANAAYSVSVFSINAINGTLTEISGSPFAAATILNHISIDPTGSFLYVGTTTSPSGTITGYSVNKITGKLTPMSSSPFNSGNWTQGITVAPNGNYLYAANYGDNTISAYSINRTSGQLTSLPSSPFLTSGGSGPQSIAFDNSNNFVYVTDILGGVVLYSQNPTTGAFTGLARYAAGNSPAFIAITH